MRITEYQQFVERLPRAAHDMEHISNFGRIVAQGFVLIASTIDRGHRRLGRQLVEALGGQVADTDAARARRKAERTAEQRRLREQLEALATEAAADDEDDGDDETDNAA